MKSKITYLITIILTLTVGVCSTLIVLYYIPPQEKIIEMINKSVIVTESETISSAIDKIYNSVVTVENYKSNLLSSIGTGFVYKTDDLYGYILTNNHVIKEATTVKVVNNQDVSLEATVMGKDEYADLAVLRVDKSFVLQVATLGNSLTTKLGDTVFTVGTPVSITYKGSVTKGIISGLNRLVTIEMDNGSYFMMDVIQTNAAINPGNSGGPLANMNGEVIGINTLKLVKDEIEGMGFSIPIEVVKTVLDRLEKGEEIKRPKLGASLIGVNETYNLYRYQIYLDKDFTHGAVVVNVDNNTVASKIGLQKKDVILRVDNYIIKNPTHFRYVLYKYNIGDTIKIEYYRDGKTKTVEAKLTEGL